MSGGTECTLGWFPQVTWPAVGWWPPSQHPKVQLNSCTSLFQFLNSSPFPKRQSEGWVVVADKEENEGAREKVELKERK